MGSILADCMFTGLVPGGDEAQGGPAMAEGMGQPWASVWLHMSDVSQCVKKVESYFIVQETIT